MKNLIKYTFQYPPYEVILSKTFDLPFTPFIGLKIIDRVEHNQVVIDIRNYKDRYCDFAFDVARKMYIVDIDQTFKSRDYQQLSVEVEKLRQNKWGIESSSQSMNVSDLCDLMKKHNEVGI